MSTKYIAPYKGVRFLESGEILLVESGIRKICFLLNPESWALESETKLKESGIHYVLESEIQVVPVCRENPESKTWNPKSTAWNPESNTAGDSLNGGR